MIQWMTVSIGGKEVRVPVLRAQGRLWFHWRGETHVLDLTPAGRKTGGQTAKANPGVISAPMPGKITRVAVAKNDPVRKGQALVVMEAMKMEYTLEADRDGKIDEVNVKAGQQVSLGDVLVRVKEVSP